MFKTVIQIDVCDWDDLVCKTYGREYSFQQQDGCKSRGIENISVPESLEEALEYDYENTTEDVLNRKREMGVRFEDWLAADLSLGSDYYKSCADLFWHRHFYPSVEMIAYDLFKRGLLPAGEYQIVIDW